MPISVDAVEYLTFQERSLTILKNERVDTGMGVLNEPLMPIPTLLLDLFGTPAKFYLKSSDNYDPSTGQVFKRQRRGNRGSGLRREPDDRNILWHRPAPGISAGLCAG